MCVHDAAVGGALSVALSVGSMRHEPSALALSRERWHLWWIENTFYTAQTNLRSLSVQGSGEKSTHSIEKHIL